MCEQSSALRTIFVLAAVIVTSFPAAAQSLTPMRGELKSFNDHFAVRVRPGNPYEHRLNVEIKVYDHTFKPIKAKVRPARMVLARRSSRNVMVIIPFEGHRQRRVRVCVESVPKPNQNTRMRTQVCGKFIARRLG